jgi:hypothetical protein
VVIRLGSGKLSKRARHVARCPNILTQKIAASHQVPDLSIAEPADRQSRFAEEEVLNAGGGNPSRQGARIADATASLILLSISGAPLNGMYETLSIFFRKPEEICNTCFIDESRLRE